VLLATAGAYSDGSDSTPGNAVSAASSLASKASGALASATAEARRRLDEVKNGVNAKDEVKLGAVTRAADGRVTAPVTVRNTAGATKSFVVQVNFTDASGNLLDTVVVTVQNVTAAQSAAATARSNRKLPGDVRAEVPTAIRY
jgi:hypothetical protein